MFKAIEQQSSRDLKDTADKERRATAQKMWSKIEVYRINPMFEELEFRKT